MKTPKTMLGLLTISLVALAGSAVAAGGSLGGTYGIDTDASAHADYSGVLKAGAAAKGAAEGIVSSVADQATSAAGQAKANADSNAKNGIKSSTSVKTGLLDAFGKNVESFSSWVSQIWVKPTVDAKHVEDMNAAGRLVSDIESQDGSLDADYTQVLESTARVDYNIPTPPAPQLGFLGEIRMAFEGVIHLI